MPTCFRSPRRAVVPVLALTGWIFIGAARLFAAQGTAAAAAPSPSPTPSAPAAPTPPPPLATADDLINALNPAEVQEAINLLRANYIRPPEVDDRSLARATLSGILTRLGNGASLQPKSGDPAASPERLPDTFVSDVFNQRAGYVRLGALTRDHLGALDKAVKSFNDNKLPALVLDLRATGTSSDYDLATEVARRFVAKGKPLFTLHKPNTQDRLFTSNADPAFTGLIIIAVDADTAGAAEAIAAVIRYYDRCLIVGDNTAGQAVEYADLRLSGGSLLRVAVSQILLPANLSIFPGGVKPDVPVSLPHADLLTIFRQAGEKDHPMASFVIDNERARFNEAALVSGVNPEFDAARDAQAARRRGEPPPRPPLRDTVIQRAFDLATAITTLDPKT